MLAMVAARCGSGPTAIQWLDGVREWEKFSAGGSVAAGGLAAGISMVDTPMRGAVCWENLLIMPKRKSGAMELAVPVPALMPSQ